MRVAPRVHTCVPSTNVRQGLGLLVQLLRRILNSTPTLAVSSRRYLESVVGTEKHVVGDSESVTTVASWISNAHHNQRLP